MTGADSHGEALGRAEQLVREAEDAVSRKDGDLAVRRAWQAVEVLKEARKRQLPSEQMQTRDLRSPLYLRAAKVAVKSERWAEARKLAVHLRFGRDARAPVRRELGKLVEECNRRMGLPSPPAQCDLVMKGGITSGVVYPLALVDLSNQYTFRCIGGSSVGAVAAAAAAAAEFSRQTSKLEAPTQGFKGLAQLPEQLGGVDPETGHSKLLSLFQPQPETAPAMNVLLAVLGGRTAAGKALGGIAAALKAEPLPFVASLVLGGLLVWAAFRTDQALLVTLSVLAAFATLLVGVLASAAVLAVRLNRAISANGFGICRGFSRSARGPDPLTAWLTELFDRIAGLRDHPGHLTFGMLWGENPADRKVDLVVTTSNLTFGRPYRLPFLEDLEKDGKVFFFNTAEFAELFPETICDQLEQAGKARLTKKALVDHWGDSLRVWAEQGFLPFPDAADLPVVVAVRMSLSFPVLLSMVPLYAVDETLGEPKRLERCWFSDGGACSNLPIHFFDSLVPSRPTFAMNLVGETPVEKVDPSDQSKNVWMPSSNVQGLSEQWNRFAERPSLFSFFGALIHTMQNWVDGMQVTTPGYRDRIVHIRHTSREGGMNLNMDPKVIRAMSERGAAAGARLREDFDWDNHLWIRLRSVLDISDHALTMLAGGAMKDPARRALIERLLDEHTGTAVPYENAPVTPQQAAELKALFPQLEALLTAKHHSYCDDAAPDPTPELKVRPRL